MSRSYDREQIERDLAEQDRRDRHRADTWIERVREADAEAEAAFERATEKPYDNPQVLALTAIAAELRAQRIARRPGAGQ